MNFRSFRGATALLIVVTGGFFAMQAASAYFKVTGNGSGQATAGTASAVTIEAASGTVNSLLVPGASADLLVQVTNPNSFPVQITGISQNGSVAASTGTGSCTTTGVSVPTRIGLSVAVAAGGHVAVHVPNGVSMSTTSDNGCQGRSFTVPVTITVQK